MIAVGYKLETTKEETQRFWVAFRLRASGLLNCHQSMLVYMEYLLSISCLGAHCESLSQHHLSGSVHSGQISRHSYHSGNSRGLEVTSQELGQSPDLSPSKTKFLTIHVPVNVSFCLSFLFRPEYEADANMG